MNENLYKVLAIIGRLVLPTAGTLYAALAGIWNFPCAEQVLGTTAALTAALNAILEWDKYNWNKAKNAVEEEK